MTKQDFKLDVKEMAEAGLHFGHKTSKTHPKMSRFLTGSKNNVSLIDLEKTKEYLEKALEAVKGLIAENKVLLVVGTKVQAKKLTEEFGIKHNLPYINERWLGGTVTNFDVMKKRIGHYNDLRMKKEKGELEKYTKKEKAQFGMELQRLEQKFKGLKDIESLPDAVFVLDMHKDFLAVKEAKGKGIITIGIADANTDPGSVDYVVPASDDSVSSVRYILDKVGEAVEKGKELQLSKEKESETETEEPKAKE